MTKSNKKSLGDFLEYLEENIQALKDIGSVKINRFSDFLKYLEENTQALKEIGGKQKDVLKYEIFNNDFDFLNRNVTYFNILNKKEFDLLIDIYSKLFENLKRKGLSNEKIVKDFNIKEPSDKVIAIGLNIFSLLLDEIKEEIFNKFYLTNLKIKENNLFEFLPLNNPLFKVELVNKIKYAFTKKDKIKVIKKAYLKKYKLLKLSPDKELYLNPKIDNFKQHVFSIIDIKTIYNYLTGKIYELDWNSYGNIDKNTIKKPSIFDVFAFNSVNSYYFDSFLIEFWAMEGVFSTMNYCKSQLEMLENTKNQSTNSKKTIKEPKKFHDFFKPEYRIKLGAKDLEFKNLEQIFIKEDDIKTVAVFVYHFKKDAFIENFRISTFFNYLSEQKAIVDKAQKVDYYLKKVFIEEENIENKPFYFNAIDKLKEFS